jgi:hypothetical protein
MIDLVAQLALCRIHQPTLSQPTLRQLARFRFGKA